MKKENNELNINLSDDINYNDELLRNTINNMQISKSSIKNYTYEMTKFLKCIGISFNDLIATISKQQHHKIENNLIIEYDPQNSLLKNYYDKYINECRTKGNKETTIQTRIRTINTILSYCNIKTPKIKFNIVNSQQKTPLLTNEDIKYILNNHCTIHHKALICFMASTGIRRYDTQQFKIIDFLKATYKYHKTLNIDEFLNNPIINMVGYWEFIPHKTKKNGLICKTCNSKESNNYIIESLKERKIAIDNYNKRNNTNIKLTSDMPLFSSRKSCYTEPLKLKSITKIMERKNHLFKQYKINSLKDDLKNDKITINEYDKLINNIPVFKLHNLRHYFISVLRHYTINRDIALIMEAHTSDIKTDKYYIGESSELFNEKTIRETYNNIEKYLTFNSDISIAETEQLKTDNEKLLNDYDNLKNENTKLKSDLNELIVLKNQLNKIFETKPFKELLENEK